MARALWKGAITFGLVNIPVELYPAEERKEFKFSMLDKRDLSPVGYKRYSKKSGKEVAWERHRQGLRVREGPVRRAVRRGFPARQRKSLADDRDPGVRSGRARFRRNISRRRTTSRRPSAARRSMRCCAKRCARPSRIAVAQVVIRTTQHLAAVVPTGAR